jgi:excisionase family DNA binding protein
MVKRTSTRKPLADLKSHREAYVTIGELAEYWMVSRKQIYKQIAAGTLRAIRLGPRLLRIRTADAIDFEYRAKMQGPSPRNQVADRSTSVKQRAQRGR